MLFAHFGIVWPASTLCLVQQLYMYLGLQTFWLLFGVLPFQFICYFVWSSIWMWEGPPLALCKAILPAHWFICSIQLSTFCSVSIFDVMFHMLEFGWLLFFGFLLINNLFEIACRYLRRTQLLSRTMVFGCGIKAGQVITTCTRSTVTQPSTELWSRCTLRWLLATGSGFLVSRSSRLLPSRLNFARGKAPSNSTTPRSSSHWCSGKCGHLPGSWRLHTRHRGPTCLCNLVIWSTSLKEGLELDLFLNLAVFWIFILFDYLRTTNSWSTFWGSDDPFFVLLQKSLSIMVVALFLLSTLNGTLNFMFLFLKYCLVLNAYTSI